MIARRSIHSCSPELSILLNAFSVKCIQVSLKAALLKMIKHAYFIEHLAFDEHLASRVIILIKVLNPSTSFEHLQQATDRKSLGVPRVMGRGKVLNCSTAERIALDIRAGSLTGLAAPTGGGWGARVKAARIISASSPSTHSTSMATTDDPLTYAASGMTYASVLDGAQATERAGCGGAQLLACARLRSSVWRRTSRPSDDAIAGVPDPYGEPSHASGSSMRSMIDRAVRAGQGRRPAALQQLPACIAVHSSPSPPTDREVRHGRA